ERCITDRGNKRPDGPPHMPDFGPILEREIADKRLISRSFGSAGSTYDGEASIQHEVARHLAALWETAGPAEGPVVEFGTGTGYLTSLISRTGRPMRLYDIVPVMDGVVRADAEIMTALLTSDPAPAAIISASTVQWFNSPRRFLRRALRALKPGAMLAISTFGPDTYRELAPFQQARPAYLSADDLRALTRELEAEGIADAAWTIVEEGERRVLTFPSTRHLLDHTRRSGVNGTRLGGIGAARALMAAAPVSLTYAPVYLLMRRR
ncbi:MAG: methyltransferase domain-containing protein, partial [Paramuribaculum sp.]